MPLEEEYKRASFPFIIERVVQDPKDKISADKKKKKVKKIA